MAITLHDKYAKKIQEKFVKESVIHGLLSDEYNWSGVKTVKVSTLETVPLVDYTRTGTSRYGTPKEMEDTVQELTLTQDKSFTMTIDKGNNADQSGIKAAGKALALEIKEQVVPMMDKYVLNVLATGAGTVKENAAAPTKEDVCERIDAGVAVLDEAEVPDSVRTLLVSSQTYTVLKQAGMFDLNADKVAEKAFSKGVVGSYSNMRVVKVPASRLPANVNFMIVYKGSGTNPVKLNDTKVHQDPPGISGNLLEGRVYYDAFVFENKKKGIYLDKTQSA